MSQKKTVKEYLEDENTKSWTIGSLSTVQGEKGPYRQVRLGKGITVYQDGILIAAGESPVANCFKVDSSKKHPKLVEMEQKYNFEKTHDISLKIKRD